MGKIIRNFLVLWTALFIVLAIISCSIYKQEIVNVVTGTWWGIFNAAMPVLFILLAIIYAIRTAFK